MIKIDKKIITKKNIANSYKLISLIKDHYINKKKVNIYGAPQYMKLWLASYPRSGNTFFRIILDELYNINSKELNPGDWKFIHIWYPVVKTHLLPDQLFPKNKKIPAIYLVRDGRDSMISEAHQKKDLVDPGSDYLENLRTIIQYQDHIGFGGWSNHVRSWMDRADLIIRYEDLIVEPIKTVKQIRQFIDLPNPIIDEVPDFLSLKNNINKGISKSVSLGIKQNPTRRENFFRRGISGSWKDEMPDELHQLFWEHHGEMMIKLGYNEGIIT